MLPVGRQPAAPAPSNDVGTRFISLYRTPPTGEVSLADLEDAATARMAYFLAIERAPLNPKEDYEMTPALAKASKEQENQCFLRLRDEEDFRRDLISHYAMRLAFARPHDRPWLIKYEEQLLFHCLGSFCAEAASRPGWPPSYEKSASRLPSSTNRNFSQSALISRS